MGKCLTKDARRSRDDDMPSRISENTIFQPEEPYKNVPFSLAKPPQLLQIVQIRTFDQTTNKVRLSLQIAQTENKDVDEFLQNDSISVVIGSQIKQQQKQKPEVMTPEKSMANHRMARNGLENCECSLQVKEKMFGMHSLYLGSGRQPQNITFTLNRSAAFTF